MKGIIGFKNLHVDCIIGVEPEEKMENQPLYIDLKVKADVSRCIQSDAICDSIDYTKLAKICVDVSKAHDYNLIETFAQKVLQEMFKTFPIQWGWIKVKKPRAIGQAEYAFIEVEEGVL
jgi:7,8-dihydroneopterin aldolase/epimerase/oxygenase